MDPLNTPLVTDLENITLTLELQRCSHFKFKQNTVPTKSILIRF